MRHALARGELGRALTLIAGVQDAPAPLRLAGVALWRALGPAEAQSHAGTLRALLAAVPAEEQEPLLQLAREWQAQGEGRRAAEMLGILAGHSPSPPLLYALATTRHLLNDPTPAVLEPLRRCLDLAPEGPLAADAWRLSGDLAVSTGEREAAIHAYRQAEQCGLDLTQLDAYRSGDWDALPSLWDHPDCPCPVVVTIDLEVDYAPDAPPGERVFEVAAVRSRGSTILAEYHTYIRRDFQPRSGLERGVLLGAPPMEAVAAALRDFTGDAIVAGPQPARLRRCPPAGAGCACR